jgi:transposase-like protein
VSKNWWKQYDSARLRAERLGETLTKAKAEIKELRTRAEKAEAALAESEEEVRCLRAGGEDC